MLPRQKSVDRFKIKFVAEIKISETRSLAFSVAFADPTAATFIHPPHTHKGLQKAAGKKGSENYTKTLPKALH